MVGGVMMSPIKIPWFRRPGPSWSMVYLVRGGNRPNLIEESLLTAMGCIVQEYFVDLGFDETVDDYVDHILYQLTLSLEAHIQPGRWIIDSRPPPPPPPSSSPADTILRATCLTVASLGLLLTVVGNANVEIEGCVGGVGVTMVMSSALRVTTHRSS
ncbi:hypothetical protein M5K25_016530 [Dendrobium thyrsiflorum]|uniref:Uncharacterized protein n=1 Tax=Dendrobium thyrsiflorum TaxID=117978 RepID=A0ABD0UK03_DENTH